MKYFLIALVLLQSVFGWTQGYSPEVVMTTGHNTMIHNMGTVSKLSKSYVCFSFKFKIIVTLLLLFLKNDRSKIISKR